MTSTAPSTRRLERSTPSETAIRWPTTELLLSAEQAICSSQQYGSCLFVAGPRQLWRVWPGVSGALSAVGLSLLLLSRQAVGALLPSADEVPLPLHPDRAGGRAGLGGFMPAAQRAG